MIQLQATSINICRISKLLVKYNIKASINTQQITLDGDISDELLSELCNGIDINSVQNFISQQSSDVSKEFESTKKENFIQPDIPESPKASQNADNTSNYDLIFPKVKRGEVYICDFGDPYGSEQGLKRFAIIIQNDAGNFFSPTTIVVPTTTRAKKVLPTHIKCKFSSENMIDYDYERVGSIENIILTEQIHTIDKRKLRKYIGKLTPDFMDELQDKIDISLGLSREVKTIVKEKMVHPKKPVPKNTAVNSTDEKDGKDLNLVQVQLLSNIDVKELLTISSSLSTNEIKVQKILELFGFNLTQNGVQYLLKAIISSTKTSHFNLETLSESLAQDEDIDKDEIKRLIVARVKENFGLKKAPTLDFIRLVNIFLV